MNVLIDYKGACVLPEPFSRGVDVKNAGIVLSELEQHGHCLILFNISDDEYNEAVSWFRQRRIKLCNVIRKGQKHPEGLIISSKKPDVPTKFNEFIAPEPYVDWNKVRQFLIKNEFLKN